MLSQHQDLLCCSCWPTSQYTVGAQELGGDAAVSALEPEEPSAHPSLTLVSPWLFHIFSLLSQSCCTACFTLSETCDHRSATSITDGLILGHCQVCFGAAGAGRVQHRAAPLSPHRGPAGPMASPWAWTPSRLPCVNLPIGGGPWFHHITHTVKAKNAIKYHCDSRLFTS